MQEDMNYMKNNIKSKISILIKENKLKESQELLNEYFQIVNDDVEAYSMKAVILIMDGKFDEADEVLKIALSMDNNNFDINYNLGYLNEQIKKFSEAVYYYDMSMQVCDEQSVKKEINNIICNIKKNNKVTVYKERKKIVFLVKQGLDSFLNDIIKGLSKEYETKKILITKLAQIDEWMEWADICWFEWCDELVAYGSSHKLAQSKKIICRLHSYEAFTGYPLDVKWENVDSVIFIAEHVRKHVIEKSDIDTKKTLVIPNGVNIANYTFKERKRGFNIAYVGYINYKKGPMLLLHTFKAIYDKDNRYKLYIAGLFQDDRYILYFNQMVKEFGMVNNVFFQGWQDDLDNWLEDKNYVLCTSVLESQNISVMQAMGKGIKPIIHNFVGAKNIYSSNYLWNSIDEAVDMIQSYDYNSNEYRKFIENSYSLEKQLEKTEALISDMNKSVSTIDVDEKIDFNYKDYWNNRLNTKFDIEGVGYIGLGLIYNKFLYESRLEILNYLTEKLFGSIKGKSVLELGPGIGIFTEFFYRNNLNDYYAIDISERSQIELSKKYKKFKFTLGDISEEKSYPNNKYDLIFAADVLLHLTNEEKYKNVMKNLEHSLKDDGFIITFDPITVIGSKGESPHVVLRDIKYIEEILKENDLQVIGMIPSTFFMNYPFDRGIIKDKSIIAKDTFDLIQVVFGSSNILDETKEELAEWLGLLDKQCLINNNFGLSQKVMIIKRKDNKASFDFNVNDIWRDDAIKLKLIQKEQELNKNEEVIKYDLVNLFKNNIDKFSNDF